MAKKRWSDFWPNGLSKIAKADLVDLDEREFQKLAGMIYAREWRLTGQKKRAKAVRRKLELKRRDEKRMPLSKKVLNYKYSECPNLASIRPLRSKEWRPPAKRKRNASDVDCANFSFIDNPVETMRTFEMIVQAECRSRGFQINFEDRYVLDIGPFLLLGALREKMTPVILGGKISQSTLKVLDAVQLLEFLQMKSFGKIRSANVWPLPMRHRHGGGRSSTTANIAVQASRAERVGDQTVSSVNEWLRNLDPPDELTQYGATNLKTVVTEALNNAERHGRFGGDGEWVTAGFMARRRDENGEIVHVCNIGLMNLGRPMSETIFEAPTKVLDQVDRYVGRHSSIGLSKETLSTVFALQDGISCVDQSGERPTGGTGMMDIAEFANGVGEPHGGEFDTRVAIVSGRSYIRFSEPYNEGVSDEGRRLQWFNAENDAEKPPSHEHVLDMPSAFPGTLVTLRFVIDRRDEESGDE